MRKYRLRHNIPLSHHKQCINVELLGNSPHTVDDPYGNEMNARTLRARSVSLTFDCRATKHVVDALSFPEMLQSSIYERISIEKI